MGQLCRFGGCAEEGTLSLVAGTSLTLRWSPGCREPWDSYRCSARQLLNVPVDGISGFPCGGLMFGELQTRTKKRKHWGARQPRRSVLAVQKTSRALGIAVKAVQVVK